MINKKLADKIQNDLATLQDDAELYFQLANQAKKRRLDNMNEDSELMAAFWAAHAKRQSYILVKKYFNIIMLCGVKEIATKTEREQIEHHYKIDGRQCVRVSIGEKFVCVGILKDGQYWGRAIYDNSIYFNGFTNDFMTMTTYEPAKIEDESSIYIELKQELKRLFDAYSSFNASYNKLSQGFGIHQYLDDKDIRKQYNRLWRAE